MPVLQPNVEGALSPVTSRRRRWFRSGGLDTSEGSAFVQERLATLPEVQRVAYQLLQQEGMSLKGAAEVLGTSVSAVKLRAHRAYQALRAVLGEKGEAT